MSNGYKKLAELMREGRQYAEESISYYCTKEPDGKWYACALGTAFIALLTDDERKTESRINYQRIFDILDRSRDFILAGRRLV